MRIKIWVSVTFRYFYWEYIRNSPFILWGGGYEFHPILMHYRVKIGLRLFHVAFLFFIFSL